MKPGFARLLVVGVSLVVLVAGVTPPSARAFTVSTVQLVAAVTVHGGIGYPLTTLPTPIETPPLNCLPLKTGPPNCHPIYDHQRAVSVFSLQCLDEVTNIDKLDKQPFHVGSCGFGGSGTITGHCDLSGGQILMIFTDALGQDFLLDLHFTTVGLIVFDGHWIKLGPNPTTAGQHGLVFGVGDDIPPQPVFTQGQSCIDKTAEDIAIPATLTFVTDPNL